MATPTVSRILGETSTPAKARKATHVGECQICGRRQLLPGDRLSLHGYTVQWSSFLGTCEGSRELPYEISCEALPPRIEKAKYQLEALRKEIAELKARTSDIAWVRVFMDGGWREKSQYVWKELPITMEVRSYEHQGKTLTYNKFYYTHPTTGKKEEVSHSSSNTTLEHVVAELNDNKIKAVDLPMLGSIKSYIGWAQNRVDNWAPKPLTAAVEIEQQKQAAVAVKRASRAVKQEMESAKYAVEKLRSNWGSNYLTELDKLGLDRRNEAEMAFYYGMGTVAGAEKFIAKFRAKGNPAMVQTLEPFLQQMDAAIARYKTAKAAYDAARAA